VEPEISEYGKIPGDGQSYKSFLRSIIEVKTVILGGGLTGITLARLLREDGKDVTVLEAEETTGGLCRSKKEAGFTFDTGGSHIIFSRDMEVLRFMHSFLGDNIGNRERNTKILYKGIMVKYPFENGLYQLPKEDLFFCINEFIQTLIRAEMGKIPVPTNFKEWIYTTFGKGIAELYMVPYNEKIWKYPTGKMSLHWVEDRVPRPPVEDVIKSAIGIETEGYTYQAVFSYPLEGGIEALIQSMEAGMEDIIHTGFRVTDIRQKDGKWLITNGDQAIEGDRIISTIPLQELCASLGNVPEEVKDAVDSLRYNSVACIFVGIKGEVPPISWLYIPDEETGLENRISFPSNYSPNVAPEGMGAILAEITFNEGDRISAMSDDDLVDHVIGSLEKMGIVNRSDVVFTGVERQKYAYVVYDLDYLLNIAIVKDFFGQKQISLVGRFSQFEYLNMDGCIRSVFDFVKGDV